MAGPALSERGLEDERLLVSQSPSRLPPLPGVLRLVDPAIGGEGVDEPVDRAHALGQGLGDVRCVELIQERAHGLGDAPARQCLGGRVDGQWTGQKRLALGLIELVEDLDARTDELLAPPVKPDLARQQRRGARRELVRPQLHETRGAEHDDGHARRAIGDGGLHNGGRASATGAARGRAHDPGLDGGLLAVGQGAQIGQLAPGVVAARQEPQQVSGSTGPCLASWLAVRVPRILSKGRSSRGADPRAGSDRMGVDRVLTRPTPEPSGHRDAPGPRRG